MPKDTTVPQPNLTSTTDHENKWAALRAAHPDFRYESYHWELTDNGLLCSFTYRIEPSLSFEHQLLFEGVRESALDAIADETLATYVFHLGLAEMANYWKLTASPQIIVEAGFLNEDQINWWHKLWMQGMGEYFFVNRIDFTQDAFLTISSTGQPLTRVAQLEVERQATTGSRVLIPVGGGKDSALSLELLKRNAPTGALLINPTPSARSCAQLALPAQDIHTVKRTLDPLLFELNAQGTYLNGHVPISSVIAFTSLLTGVVFDYQLVAISNEHSSNEGNVRYLNHTINHQYSKTFAFERSFQEYVANHLPAGTPRYFSFLRPWYELQIAQQFAQRCQAYFPVFHSCNRGQKTDSWCGACPKCLFAYSILAPFIPRDELVLIFGKDLFADLGLYGIAQELVGATHQKPFECVGTYEETKCALYLSVRALQNSGAPLPALLQRIQDEVLAHETDLEARSQAILGSYNREHRIPSHLESIIKTASESMGL